MAEAAEPRGFDAADFTLLERLAAIDAVGAADESAVRALWSRTEALLHQAARQADAAGLEVDLWPWQEDGAPCPFLWARLKRPDRRSFAVHVGLFLSPDHCNLAVDLEKDRIAAGRSAESLEDVLAFYREHAPAVLDNLDDPEIRVWSDLDNVLEVEEFMETGLQEFLAANRDEDHPWPKVGYLLQRQELEAHPGDQPRVLAGRMHNLLPVYDALIASCEA